MSALERNQEYVESMVAVNRIDAEIENDEKFARMRDRFAMAALPEIIREHFRMVRGTQQMSGDWRERVSRNAYKIADAMIEVRDEEI